MDIFSPALLPDRYALWKISKTLFIYLQIMFFMLFLAFYGQILQTNLFPSFSFISTNVFLDDFVFLIVRRNYRPLRRLNANWPFFPPPLPPPPPTPPPPPADHIGLKLACAEGSGVKWPPPPPRVRSFFRWGPFRPMQIEQKMISPRCYFHTKWKSQSWARDNTAATAWPCFQATKLFGYCNINIFVVATPSRHVTET